MEKLQYVLLVILILVLSVVAVFLAYILVANQQGTLDLDAFFAGEPLQFQPFREDPILPEASDAGQSYLDGTLFLGDSNTVRLAAYGLVPEDQCIAQDSIGIQAAYMYPIATVDGETGLTMPEAVALLEPERVVMTFGTNNIGALSVEEFIDEYTTAIEAIRDAYDCPIIVNSIYPICERNSYPQLRKEDIEAYNEALRELCREENLFYLHSTDALADEEGWCRPDYAEADGIHLNEAGLRAFLRYFRTHAHT